MEQQGNEKPAKHRSTGRVLDVLELVGGQDSNRGYTLTEMSEALNVPKGSLSPILHTLLARGYLSIDALTSRYNIGAMLYTVGNAYVAKGGIHRDIQDIMEGVVAEVSETCHFAELSGGEVVYLLKVDTPEAIRMFAAPGRRLPAYTTSLGKALLSGKSPEELERLYPDGLQAITENTLTDMGALHAQLEEVRRSGYAYEVEESTPYIRCIAVPILSGSDIRYAMSVAVPVFRYAGEKEERIRALLAEAKGRIEALLVNSRGQIGPGL